MFCERLEVCIKHFWIDYQEFDKKFIEILNKHAPVEKKLVRENQAPYMTKALHKAIVRRSELETKYLKEKTNDTLKAYKNCSVIWSHVGQLFK